MESMVVTGDTIVKTTLKNNFQYLVKTTLKNNFKFFFTYKPVATASCPSNLNGYAIKIVMLIL